MYHCTSCGSKFCSNDCDTYDDSIDNGPEFKWWEVEPPEDWDRVIYDRGWSEFTN